MKWNEFRKLHFGQDLSRYSQRTRDMAEVIRERFDDPDFTFDEKIWNARYDIKTELEIMDSSKPDYGFWLEIHEGIMKLEQ